MTVARNCGGAVLLTDKGSFTWPKKHLPVHENILSRVQRFKIQVSTAAESTPTHQPFYRRSRNIPDDFHDFPCAMPLLGELKASINSSRSMPVSWVSICVTSSSRWSKARRLGRLRTTGHVPEESIWIYFPCSLHLSKVQIYANCIAVDARWLWYCEWSSSFEHMLKLTWRWTRTNWRTYQA